MRFVVDAEAMTAYGNDVVVFIQLSQAVTQAAHQGVDGLFGNTEAVGARPNYLDDGVAAAHGTFRIVEQL